MQQPKSTKPLISIIIPLYNKEKYINGTLESIVKQTEEDWECIIINDGSTDKSEAVVRDFCEKDPRFKLINQNNGGASVARNTGIRHASGRLLHFLDADDYYPATTTLEQVGIVYKQQGEKPNAIAGNIGLQQLRNEEVDYNLDVNVSENKLITFRELQNDYFFTRFFFDRGFVIQHGLFFPEYTTVGEDPVFLVKTLSLMPHFLLTNIPVYVYNREASTNSGVSGFSDEKILGYIKSQIEILEICSKEHYESLKSVILNRINNEMFDTYYKKSQASKDIRKGLEEIITFVDVEYYDELLKSLKNNSSEIMNLRDDSRKLKEENAALLHPGIKTSIKFLKASLARKIRKIKSQK